MESLSKFGLSRGSEPLFQGVVINNLIWIPAFCYSKEFNFRRIVTVDISSSLNYTPTKFKTTFIANIQIQTMRIQTAQMSKYRRSESQPWRLLSPTFFCVTLRQFLFAFIMCYPDTINLYCTVGHMFILYKCAGNEVFADQVLYKFSQRFLSYSRDFVYTVEC
jgi:hypothetical protein